MKAMIFAAGKGSRLRPLTDTMPKAMVPLLDKPLMLWVAEKLMDAGVREIVINVHHHAQLMKEFINSLNYKDVRFYIADETDLLLDTGGGLKNAEPFLKGCKNILLHNADVISDINLRAMIALHERERPLATLAVSKRPSSRQFLWHQGRLAGWVNKVSGESFILPGFPRDALKPLAFSGVHIVSAGIFSQIKQQGSFSIKDLYLELAGSHRILSFEHDPRHWADTGTPAKLKEAEKMVQQNPERFLSAGI